MTEDDSSAVLILTVTDCAREDMVFPFHRETRILCGARSDKANPAYPNVVSVPSQRLPKQLAREMLALAKMAQSTPGSKFYESAKENSNHPIIYSVSNLLSRKLGLADALESGDFIYSCAFQSETVGVSKYPGFGAPGSFGQGGEQIHMLNFIVSTPCARLIPSRTASYSSIVWPSVAEFMQMYESKDAALAGLNGYSYSPAGLCIDCVYRTLSEE